MPPRSEGITAGTEPFYLSGNIVWRGNEWVQVDPVSGKVMEKIQRHFPYNYEAFDPGKRLNEQLNVLPQYTEQYQVVAEKYGVEVGWSIENDATKEQFPVELNIVNFPQPEETMAEVFLEVYYRSVCRTKRINFSKEGFEEYLRQWKEAGQPPVGNMKFEAYWDGETTMREGEMPVPTKPIRLIYVDR